MWLPRRWLLGAVAATTCLVVLSTAFSMAGVDLNIDTSDNVANGFCTSRSPCPSWVGAVLRCTR